MVSPAPQTHTIGRDRICHDKLSQTQKRLALSRTYKQVIYSCLYTLNRAKGKYFNAEKNYTLHLEFPQRQLIL